MFIIKRIPSKTLYFITNIYAYPIFGGAILVEALIDKGFMRQMEIKIPLWRLLIFFVTGYVGIL